MDRLPDSQRGRQARRGSTSRGSSKTRSRKARARKSSNDEGSHAGTRAGSRAPTKIRYAVVGLGHISQVAVLPAFAHALRNTELVALVSDDPTKLTRLGRKYRAPLRASYSEYDALLGSGDVDAVYIALPNAMHREYAVRAANAGVHVLCEKPLATTAEDCRAMISAAAKGGVKLMTAYRLHFEQANMHAVELVTGGRIGEPRYFHSMFSMQVEDEDNIRLDAEQGGGPIFDLGVYCINAARYLFRDEPIEVSAMHGRGMDERFREVPAHTSVLLRFPGDRLASFTCSFGASDASMYRLVGTKGSLELDPAYDYSEPLEQRLVIGSRATRKKYPKRDQFAPELLHFSQCILEDREPVPSGREGLADVRVIEAALESARTGRAVRLPEFEKRVYPSVEHTRYAPPVEEPEEIHARGPR
jgi:predicted dehydrogenase